MKIPKYKYLFIISDISIISSVYLFTILAIREFDGFNIAVIKTAISPIILASGLILIELLIFSYNNLYKLSLVLVKSAHLTAITKSLLITIVIIEREAICCIVLIMPEIISIGMNGKKA